MKRVENDKRSRINILKSKLDRFMDCPIRKELNYVDLELS